MLQSTHIGPALSALVVALIALTAAARAEEIDWAKVPARRLPIARAGQVNLGTPATVKFALGTEDGKLHVRFDVKGARVNAPRLKTGEFVYQHDAVEVFISAGQNARHDPYYEFEVSPNNEISHFKIIDRAVGKAQSFDLVGYEHEGAILGNSQWYAELKIPVDQLEGWDGDLKHVYGNAYAILGTGKRSYYSLHKLSPKWVGFHEADRFRPLLP